jgi:hypothetical protein
MRAFDAEMKDILVVVLNDKKKGRSIELFIRRERRCADVRERGS